MKPAAILTAAALVLGASSISFAQSNQNRNGANTNAPQNMTGDRGRQAGDTANHAVDWMKQPGAVTQPAGWANNPPDQDAIRSSLKSLTNDALNKGNFNDVVDHFVDADRTRIRQNGFARKDKPTLNGIIDQIDRDWKVKYGDNFKVKQTNVVFDGSTYQVWEGEETGNYNPAQAAVGRMSAAATQPSGDDNKKAGMNKPGTPAADENRSNKGRNIAIVTVAG